MKQIFSAIIIILTYNFALSQTDTLLNLYNAGNQAYKENNYEQAIVLYEQILDAGYQAPEVYYNLGNAYFKQNNVAKAILNYERALKLKPGDEDIKNNIKYANLFVKDEFNNVPTFVFDRIYNAIVHIFSSNTWAILSIVAFVLSLALFLVFLFSKVISRRKLSFFLSIILIVISAISFVFSAQMKNYFTKPNAAIIMNINTIKSSPEDDGTDLYILNPGIKVQIKDQAENWLEVRLPNGKIGWIKKENVEII
jgi:tetratricopeptide (TPR) repeat protein